MNVDILKDAKKQTDLKHDTYYANVYTVSLRWFILVPKKNMFWLRNKKTYCSVTCF